jgi:hypothetical protein
VTAVSAIADFKHVHDGKRVFVLASGPSLAQHDLSRLRRRLVIGLNRSVWAYPDSHYHCTMDQRLFDEYPEVLRSTRYLFTLEGRPFGMPLRLLGAEGFSEDLTQGIYSGYTVAYFALQVAVYMGFREVFFLGLDLDHRAGQTHFFGHDFRSRNHVDTEFPRMRRMLSLGAEHATRLGVRVYTCSPASGVDGFETISYDLALAR